MIERRHLGSGLVQHHAHQRHAAVERGLARNLLFSVHMYEVYQSLAPIQTYMQAFDDMALPLVIGEFGPINNGQFVDSDSVIAQAQLRGNGYIGWSWSGNGGGGTGLDMTVNFDPAQLTTWGNRIVNGTNGIRATSVLATVFGTSTNNLTVSPTTLSFGSAASSSAIAVTANVSWTVTDNQTWLSASPTSGSNNGSFTVSATANSGTTSRTGTVTVTGGGLSRTVAVTQAGTTANTLTVSATSLALASGATSGTFSITSNVGWTVTDDQSWITVTPTSGSNNATVTVSATANTATTSRTGTVTVSGGGITRTVAVTQAGQSTGGGATCPNPVTFSGNTGNFNTTGAACYRTNANINGWGCYNFEGRTLTVGGVARTCGQMPLTRSADGYYYFAATAGQFPWAGIYAW